MSELTSTAATTDGVGEWGSWKPWLFLGIVIPLVIIQLKVVNIGAEFFQATKYFPAYNSGLMVMVVLYGAVFFQEHQALHPIAFPTGVVCLCFGIALLAGKDPSDESAVAASYRINEELSLVGGDGTGVSVVEMMGSNKRLNEIKSKYNVLVQTPVRKGTGWTPTKENWTPPVEADAV